MYIYYRYVSIVMFFFYIYIYIVLNNSLSHTHIKNTYILYNLVLVNHKRGQSLFSSPIWLASLSLISFFLSSLYYVLHIHT